MTQDPWCRVVPDLVAIEGAAGRSPVADQRTGAGAHIHPGPTKAP